MTDVGDRIDYTRRVRRYYANAGCYYVTSADWRRRRDYWDGYIGDSVCCHWQRRVVCLKIAFYTWIARASYYVSKVVYRRGRLGGVDFFY